MRALLLALALVATPALAETPLNADEFDAEYIETLEEELLDQATAARTVEELEAELLELADLTLAACKVRDSGQDRKWSELSSILQDNSFPAIRVDGPVVVVDLGHNAPDLGNNVLTGPSGHVLELNASQNIGTSSVCRYCCIGLPTTSLGVVPNSRANAGLA